MAKARSEILARGEKPIALEVEPSGSEIARPTGADRAQNPRPQEPDPRGAVPRDTGDLVSVEIAAVPTRLAKGQPACVHPAFSPDQKRQVLWDNRGGALRVWLSAPSGVRLSKHLCVVPLPARPETGELRQVDFELSLLREFKGPAALKGYALYAVCEGRSGRCLFLRKDFTVPLPSSP